MTSLFKSNNHPCILTLKDHCSRGGMNIKNGSPRIAGRRLYDVHLAKLYSRANPHLKSYLDCDHALFGIAKFVHPIHCSHLNMILSYALTSNYTHTTTTTYTQISYIRHHTSHIQLSRNLTN